MTKLLEEKMAEVGDDPIHLRLGEPEQDPDSAEIISLQIHIIL
jgi:hypothetical protein